MSTFRSVPPTHFILEDFDMDSTEVIVPKYCTRQPDWGSKEDLAAFQAFLEKHQLPRLHDATFTPETARGLAIKSCNVTQGELGDIISTMPSYPSQQPSTPQTETLRRLQMHFLGNLKTAVVMWHLAERRLPQQSSPAIVSDWFNNTARASLAKLQQNRGLVFEETHAFPSEITPASAKASAIFWTEALHYAHDRLTIADAKCEAEEAGNDGDSDQGKDEPEEGKE